MEMLDKVDELAAWTKEGCAGDDDVANNVGKTCILEWIR